MPLFGTDGVRGLANGPLTADLALTLAQATAVVLGQGRTAEARKAAGKRLTAVVARDPRVSGEFLAAAVSAGLASSGVDVLDAGVLPTPATAYLIADIDADFGVMVSASHNPAPDNGIKIFARGGVKLPDVVEQRIEHAMTLPKLQPTGAGVGRIRRFADAEDRYVVHLLASLPHRLDGLHVVLDCAHGAASGVSPETFRDAGARVTVIGADPDGLNINDGVGSTHLDLLAEHVVRVGADVGIAHDGDADRCLAVDARGRVVDGDQIMAVLAVAMKQRGHLVDDTLVATVMSNLGLHRAMADHGITVVQTGVGDRYVLEAMAEGGFSLGGEQSGHVIMSEYATTGDGVLTGLHLMAEMARTGRTLADLASIMTVYPQVLVNVRGVDRTRAATDQGVADAVAAVAAELGDSGRVLLRPSGTEEMVRVMVEAADSDRRAGLRRSPRRRGAGAARAVAATVVDRRSGRRGFVLFGVEVRHLAGVPGRDAVGVVRNRAVLTEAARLGSAVAVARRSRVGSASASTRPVGLVRCRTAATGLRCGSRRPRLDARSLSAPERSAIASSRAVRSVLRFHPCPHPTRGIPIRSRPWRERVSRATAPGPQRAMSPDGGCGAPSRR